MSAQDRELQDEITAWERSLEAARDDAEVQAILAPVGFGPDALDAILTLVSTTQKRYNERAEAMGAEETAGDEKAALFANARETYAVFRKLARARFEGNDAALEALSLNGKVPKAFNPFVTHARGAYANAAVSPYTELLAGRGYPPERCLALTNDLDRLVDSAKTATDARKRAKQSTRIRSDAATAARKAFAEYRDTARPLLGPLAERVGL